MENGQVQISPEQWAQAQRHAQETEQKRIDAQRDTEREQLRLIAMNCSLASYGRGHQQISPIPGAFSTADLVARAGAILAFFEGRETPATVLEMVRPSSTPPDAA